ncbi:MAG: TIGR03013 family PEP-CTERM/XrtA system glycosyltransferase [Deltaproteobacteria bacterium]|nr:TIGR03013 family PEP-CTERM/XrtA system glycosyltransferase [Deltaproteobacteria bacterium]
MKADREKTSNMTVIGNFSEISSLCKNAQVDRIVVALDERRGTLPVEELLGCRLKGIQVDDGVAFSEHLSGKLSVENLRPSSLIFSNHFKRSAIYKGIKRSVDRLSSVLGLAISSPALLLIALAIKWDSPGPVLYRQERVGEDGKGFELLKFRSMRVDAEANGPVWAMREDTRVTRVGRIIRKLRLDEIPQMLNVLRGEMSFVGPRPERPFFVERLKREIPFYTHRHSVVPGITGWAQIYYPYGASKEDAQEKLKYDLYYIKHASLLMDLTIILETFKIILLGRGAR